VLPVLRSRGLLDHGAVADASPRQWIDAPARAAS
jgi:hypothetical protein